MVGLDAASTRRCRGLVARAVDDRAAGLSEALLTDLRFAVLCGLGLDLVDLGLARFPGSQLGRFLCQDCLPLGFHCGRLEPGIMGSEDPGLLCAHRPDLHSAVLANELSPDRIGPAIDGQGAGDQGNFAVKVIDLTVSLAAVDADHFRPWLAHLDLEGPESRLGQEPVPLREVPLGPLGIGKSGSQGGKLHALQFAGFLAALAERLDLVFLPDYGFFSPQIGSDDDLTAVEQLGHDAVFGSARDFAAGHTGVDLFFPCVLGEGFEKRLAHTRGLGRCFFVGDARGAELLVSLDAFPLGFPLVANIAHGHQESSLW